MRRLQEKVICRGYDEGSRSSHPPHFPYSVLGKPLPFRGEDSSKGRIAHHSITTQRSACGATHVWENHGK